MTHWPGCGLRADKVALPVCPKRLQKEAKKLNCKSMYIAASCNNAATPLLSKKHLLNHDLIQSVPVEYATFSSGDLYPPQSFHCCLSPSFPKVITLPCPLNPSSSHLPYLLDRLPLPTIKYRPLSAPGILPRKCQWANHRSVNKQDVAWQVGVRPKGTQVASDGQTSAIVSASTLRLRLTFPRPKVVGFRNTRRIVEAQPARY